jgi:hypothetical protein
MGRQPFRGVAGRRPGSGQWIWGLLTGLGMIVAAGGATAITSGPVLLWYDVEFLGMDVTRLHEVNHHLVHFLQHDRLTLAGTMASIGILYCGLSYGGMRRGLPWARNALLVSGCIGFPTLFYFVAYEFPEPLHIAATAVLLPMFVAAVRRPLKSPRQTQRERLRPAQILFVCTGIGLFIGGATISVVGLTDVFVPSDLEFLRTTPEALTAANPRIIPFIAHDRAGFGGALMSAAAAITLLSAWGWRRGESWVWWTLTLATAAGFLPAVTAHATMGYTDFLHVAPLYAGLGASVIALVLGWPLLSARGGRSRCRGIESSTGCAGCRSAAATGPGRRAGRGTGSEHAGLSGC